MIHVTKFLVSISQIINKQRLNLFRWLDVIREKSFGV